MPTLIPASCSQNATCAQLIQNALCSHDKERHVKLEAGKVYPLLDQLSLLPWEPAGNQQIPCYSTNQTSTILDGQGATLLMDNKDDLMGLLWARGVEKGLLMKNFSVATSRAHYTLASLLPSSSGVLSSNSLAISEENGRIGGKSLVRVSDPDLYPPPCHLSSKENHWLHHVKAIIGWDRDNRRPSEAEYDWYVDLKAEWLECKNETMKGIVRLHFPAPVDDPRLPTEPNSILLRHDIYGHHVFIIEISENLQMQDIWIQSGGGMAVATDQIQKGISLERVHVKPDGNHTFSVAADGFHLGATRGGDVLIDGCEVQNQGDDGINIKSLYLILREWSGNKIYYNLKDNATTTFTWRVWESDRISFYSRKTFEQLFTTRVVFRTEFDFNETGILSLEHDIPSTVKEFDLVVNENTFADSVTIANCLYGWNRGRGGLLENDNLRVYNTTFEYITGAAIQVVPGCIPDSFCEGHVIRSNWTVENCTFNSNDFWNWSHGVIYVGAEVPVFEEGKPTNSTKLQLTTGIQHQDFTIRNCLFNATSSSCRHKSSFIGYGIDGLVLDGIEGCDNFTIASSCINVSVQRQNESFMMTTPEAAITELLREKPSAQNEEITSHASLAGAHFPLQLFWLIILVTAKLFR